MKRILVVVACLIAAAVVVGIAARLRSEMLGRNAELSGEVARLRSELSTAGPHADWRRYENRELGFELRYPPSLFSGEAASAAVATARNGMKGIQLSQPRSGCVLEVYRAPAPASSNPFDETGVAPTENRYVASARLGVGGVSYYLGMGVVSHAVDPQRVCVPAFNQILATVRLLPRTVPSPEASAAPTAAGSEVDAESLARLQVADPRAALREDLMKHPGLIPFHGTLGGTLAFHDPSAIVLLPGHWVYATFDDGHVEGRLIAAWEITSERRITWRLVTAECPGC